MPVPTKRSDAEYTEEARNAKIEGAVLLQVVIDEKGIPTEPEVERSLDKGLDQKAIEAVKQCRFKPALKDGKPVSVFANIEINFRLPK
jgi:protein TonB